MDMGPTLITLGVRDLAASRRFVEALGWQPMAEPEGVFFFDIGGLILALFPHTELAKDGHVWEVAHNPAWTIGPHGRIVRR